MNKIYYINYNFSFPYEIYVNEVLLERDLLTGRSGPDRLNNYILESGKQKIKIRVFAPKNYNGGLLKDKDLIILSEQSALYKVNSDDKSYTLIKRLNFDTITQDVPFYEQEWIFNADLPFELEGWKNSKDLSKIDQEELQQKVEQKYKMLYELLNQGKVDEFLKEIDFSNNEFFKANYFNDSQKKEYIDNLRKSYLNFKGKMLPFNTGKIQIMGNGKTVSLRTLTGKYKGLGVLIAEDHEKQNVYFNNVILHIPTGANELKVVRINSLGAKLE
ncbi:hypothetical protein EQP59_05180 [Ornithobacterium rhinotracheale]|uniref:Uncharacterized protein n=1 Tax=Ornithobacterium rhinotracheale TaxID=28251 RepID=A0A3R5UVL7_ORNRH|nr:hypothetical protein [Ornithobacterium rhinotracheale]QAR30772.1 hypothetical protein EQP59_05180 [Ornithobacterium rhinotracheale]